MSSKESTVIQVRVVDLNLVLSVYTVKPSEGGDSEQQDNNSSSETDMCRDSTLS